MATLFIIGKIFGGVAMLVLASSVKTSKTESSIVIDYREHPEVLNEI